MGFSFGIVGLPNVGKSTLFNALTRAGAECANYPFCTIDPNKGVVEIPDERLYKLSKISGSAKTIPTTLEFYDIAGLVKGASSGEGLGNQFLSHIREVDAIVQVVRCFKDNNVAHVFGSIDPLQDIETIKTELLLADLETVARRIAKTEKLAKSGDKKLREDLEIYRHLQQGMNEGKPARMLDIPAECIYDLHLLTQKPVLYVANLGEDKSDLQLFETVRSHAQSEGAMAVSIQAGVEAELSELDEEERKEFQAEYDVGVCGLDKMTQAGYRLLQQITFFTSGEKETRAWTVTQGAKAPQAAGRIHTDFERGFIRAEVYPYQALEAAGSEAVVRGKGLIRSEGKDYVVRDGDIIYFRSNV
jgi:GTP-binding protein YchF